MVIALYKMRHFVDLKHRDKVVRNHVILCSRGTILVASRKTILSVVSASNVNKDIAVNIIFIAFTLLLEKFILYLL
jgi:hypothetical protein